MSSLLLWLIAIALFVLWALGAFVVDWRGLGAFVEDLGGLVHLLLVVALILVIINLVRMMWRRRGHS